MSLKKKPVVLGLVGLALGSLALFASLLLITQPFPVYSLDFYRGAAWWLAVQMLTTTLGHIILVILLVLGLFALFYLMNGGSDVQRKGEEHVRHSR